MTTCSRGDVVLVTFVFADEKDMKQRPGALVGDYRLERWKEAGLPLPSTVTGIIRTIKQDMNHPEDRGDPDR